MNLSEIALRFKLYPVQRTVAAGGLKSAFFVMAEGCCHIEDAVLANVSSARTAATFVKRVAAHIRRGLTAEIAGLPHELYINWLRARILEGAKLAEGKLAENQLSGRWD